MYSRSHASIGYRRHGSRSSSRSSLKTQQEKKAALEKQQKLREARQTQMLFEVPSHFRCLRVVGKGAYGMVCEAIDRKAKKGEERVAIKKIKEALYHPLDAKLVLRELKISRLIGKHPNILGIRDLIKPSSKRRMDTIYIVSDFMDTDLYRLCQSQVEFTENHVRHLLYQMLCGLNFMHSANILHRDMKTANLLVDRNFNLQICDFGLARFATPGFDYNCEDSTGSVPEEDDVKNGPPPLTELVVTLWYRAPELVANSHYNSSIDLWAVGCIFAEMLLRRPLFPGRDHLHQLQLITDIMGTPTESDIRTIRGAYARRVLRSLPYRPPKAWRSVFPNASGAAIDLLQRLLVFDASKRLTAEEALDHPYLRDLKTPVRDMKVETPLNSEFEFDQLTSPKMHPMRQLIYNEIMLYHDPSSELAQERGRGVSRRPSFGSSSSRDNSVSPTFDKGRTRGRSYNKKTSRTRSRSRSTSRTRLGIGTSRTNSRNNNNNNNNNISNNSSKANEKKEAPTKTNERKEMPTRTSTAPEGATRSNKRPSSAARTRTRPSTVGGNTKVSAAKAAIKVANKELDEVIAKEKAFLATGREELSRQSKLVDRFEKMRRERSKSRSPNKSKARTNAFVATATVAKVEKVEKEVEYVVSPAIISAKAIYNANDDIPRPPSRDSNRPQSRDGRPPSANTSLATFGPMAFEPPPRPPSRESSRGKATPPCLPPSLPPPTSNSKNVEAKSEANDRTRVASPVRLKKVEKQEEIIVVEKKKTPPVVGGALQAIKSARQNATTTPAKTSSEESKGKKKKRSPAGTGLEAVKALSTTTATIVVAEDDIKATIASPVSEVAKETVAKVDAKARVTTDEDAKARVSEAAKALDAILNNNSNNKFSDNSNSNNKINNNNNNNIVRKAKKSFSSTELRSKYKPTRSKENSRPTTSSTWVFKPTQLARTRRRLAAVEAEKNGKTVMMNPMLAKAGKEKVVEKKKKKITVCKPFNFATSSRFSTPKHKKAREAALKRKERIAREVRRRRTHRF